MAFVGRFNFKNMLEIMFELTHDLGGRSEGSPVEAGTEIVRVLIRIKKTQNRAKINYPLSANKPPLVPSP